MNAAPDSEFWHFSIEFYRRPGVEPALLRLQDEAGKDVNLALYCLYAGLRLGRALDQDDLRALEDAIAHWTKTVVQPLRRVRQELKERKAQPGIRDLRQTVKDAELQAERIGQARLTAALAPRPVAAGDLAAARANLMLYAGDGAAEVLTLLGAAPSQESPLRPGRG